MEHMNVSRHWIWAAAVAVLNPLTHSARPGIKIHASAVTQVATVGFLTHCISVGTPIKNFLLEAVGQEVVLAFHPLWNVFKKINF